MPNKKLSKRAAKKSQKQAEESQDFMQDEYEVDSDEPTTRAKSQRDSGKTHSIPAHIVVGLPSQLPAPEHFDFTNPVMWPKWIKRFERYRTASELYLKPNKQQISTLLYTLGQESEELFTTFALGDEEDLEYEDVVNAFERYLGLRKNIVYERAKFLKRRQTTGEPIDAFIKDLHKLAESCELGQLKESLTRDLIVIGVSDQKLSETLQMDETLTLHKAITKVRQAEMVSKQQSVVRGDLSAADVGAIGTKTISNKQTYGNKEFDCRRCGTVHGPRKCPAFKERCAKCKFRGHFAKCCPNGPKTVKEIEADDPAFPEFLGEIKVPQGICPSVNVKINDQTVKFKMDTGADVSVMGRQLAQTLGLEIKPTNKVLFGPGKTKLTVEGVCTTTIKYKSNKLRDNIYILPSQNTPLLSRNALLELGLLTFNVNLVDAHAMQSQHPAVFRGMGKMNQPYKIALQEDAVPYAVMSPRRVAVSLHQQVKAELQRMVSEDMIEPITEPTDWCSPIVVVPRKGGRIRLCVDYTKLNKHVKREFLQLPSVEESLAKLEGGKYFTKLDAADSSSYGLGAVIEQSVRDKVWQPLAFASRTITETESRYAPIEKEALALTWACEKFSSYILGKRFQLYTDHKPLVEIMRTKPVSELSARLQRFRLRMLNFDYKVTHIAGKDNCTADCLSRSPDASSIDKVADSTEEETFIRSIIEALPCSNKRLSEIKKAQMENAEGRELLNSVVENKWRKNSVFWKYRNELVIEDGLIVKGRRMFIPRALRTEILAKLHEGHLGIVKCRHRAQESVWWPGCSTDIGSMVENCMVCIQHRQQRREPLIPTKLPQEPWTYLGVDLLKCNQKWYLVIQDYFSRFLELVELNSLTSASVISKMKNIFARHGIPLEVRTDGGTQFTSDEFQNFAKQYGFKTATSSPHFPQSNGEAENAVAIAKRILLKCSDPNLGLLAYRTTKLESGLSPAELLYGRKLRSTLLSLSDFQVVKKEEIEAFRKHDGEIKSRGKLNFDRSKGVKELKPLTIGQKVWVRDVRMDGTVKAKTDHPRSYLIALRNGGEVRRNRWHLIPMQVREGEERSAMGFSRDDLTNTQDQGQIRRSTRTSRRPLKYN